MEQENKMGVMPVNKLLISMSLPMIVSMLVQAMYNIVDSIFVAMLNENALTAVSLAFPMQSLMIAFAGGTAVGVNALLSRSLGEKDLQKVNQTATNSVLIYLVTSIIFSIFGLTCSRLFFTLQTTDMEIINYGSQYGMIAIGCCFGVFGQFLFERLLQATGRTFYTMITQGTGAIINIILDPIFIFGWMGIPAMGVAGAALATVIGQLIACGLAIYFNVKKNKDISLNFKGFKPNFAVIKQIYSVGIPSIIMQSIGSVMTFSLNSILITFSTTATAVFGVYFKLQSFIFMPVFGLNNGLIPILSYNLGAKRPDRMSEAIKLAMTYAVAIMFVGIAIFEFFPQTLLAFFNASSDMMTIGVPALRIIAIHFAFAGFAIVIGAVFQSVGKGTYSLITSIIRQLAVLIPSAYILSLFGNVNLVWFAFPIAEIASAITSVILFRKIKKQFNI